MAKRSVGSLFIDIEARTARLEADLAKTRGILQRLNSQVGVMGKGFSTAFGLAKGAVAAFAGVAAAKALKNMAMQTLENVRAQMQLAEVTSLSIDDIKAYEEASEHLGVSNLNLAKTMKELFSMQSDVRAGNKEATKQVRQMGLSVEEFGNLKPAELFETVVDGLNRIGSVSQRAALSQKIFGKEAVNLAVLLTQGKSAIAESRKEMDRLNQTTSNYDTARVQVALGAVAELSDRWEVFKKKLAIGLTPLIYTLADGWAKVLASVDIEAFAKKVSHWVLATAGFIMTIPERVRVLFKEIQLMWYEFISQFDTGSVGFLEKMFGTQTDNAAKVNQIRAEITSLKTTIVSAAASMETEFNEKVQAILNKILTLPPVVSSVSTAISSGTKEMVETFSSSFQRLADITDSFLDGESVKFGDWFRDLVKQMIKTFLKVSLINPMLNAVFGGMMGGTSGGWWTALPAMFGGGKAHGGPVMAGDTHVFGEHGPELGTVSRSGYITPNDRLRNTGGGGGHTFIFNNSYSSGLQRADLAAIIPQIITQSKAAVADAFGRGGGFRRAMTG